MFLLVVALVGGFAVVSGLVMLVRTVRGYRTGTGGPGRGDGDLTVAEALSWALMGVALVLGGGFLVYFVLWAEGILVL